MKQRSQKSRDYLMPSEHTGRRPAGSINDAGRSLRRRSLQHSPTRPGRSDHLLHGEPRTDAKRPGAVYRHARQSRQNYQPQTPAFLEHDPEIASRIRHSGGGADSTLQRQCSAFKEGFGQRGLCASFCAVRTELRDWIFENARFGAKPQSEQMVNDKLRPVNRA